MKHYAKKRESVQAVQWLGGDVPPEVGALIAPHKRTVRHNVETGQLELGNGWYVRVGDWILSASGEDVTVIGDEVFRRVYEEVDESGRAPPTDDERPLMDTPIVEVAG